MPIINLLYASILQRKETGMYIIADRPKEIQPEKLPSRRERRVEQLELYRIFKKLKKRIKSCDLPVDFDNDSCTSVGNFASIESFKRGIG